MLTNGAASSALSFAVTSERNRCSFVFIARSVLNLQLMCNERMVRDLLFRYADCILRCAR